MVGSSWIQKVADRIGGTHTCIADWEKPIFHTSKVNSNSAYPETAMRYRCRCGNEWAQLTPAGLQQKLWGDDENELRGDPVVSAGQPDTKGVYYGR